MTRTTHARLLLAAAVGLSGMVACSAPGTPATDTSRAGAGAGASAGTDAGAASQQDAGGAPFQIHECSIGQVVAIGMALDAAEINAANLALSSSTNGSVEQLAQTLLTDYTTLDQQLTSSGVVPVQSDISRQITAESTLLLQALRSSTHFDRDYVSGEIISQMTGLAVLEHLSTTGPGAGSLVDFVAGAIPIVDTQLQAAFMVEAELVGACGTPGVDAGASGGAGPTQDAGANACADAAP